MRTRAWLVEVRDWHRWFYLLNPIRWEQRCNTSYNQRTTIRRCCTPCCNRTTGSVPIHPRRSTRKVFYKEVLARAKAATETNGECKSSRNGPRHQIASHSAQRLPRRCLCNSHIRVAATFGHQRQNTRHHISHNRWLHCSWPRGAVEKNIHISNAFECDYHVFPNNASIQ